MTETLTIIGLGRFGQVAASLLEKDFHINTIDPADPAGPWPRIGIADLINSEHVLLCVPINQLQAVLASINPYLQPGATVLDTCSVKIKPCQWMQQLLPNNVHSIATHPLFGPDSYHTANKIIIHSVQCAEERWQLWHALFIKLGLEPIIMDPDQHDQTIGLTQCLTHYIGRVLDGIERPDTDISTLGYKKLCEVQQQTCHDQWQLFLDIMRYNPYSASLLKNIIAHQQHLNNVLTTNEVQHGH